MHHLSTVNHLMYQNLQQTDLKKSDNFRSATELSTETQVSSFIAFNIRPMPTVNKLGQTSRNVPVFLQTQSEAAFSYSTTATVDKWQR